MAHSKPHTTSPASPVYLFQIGKGGVGKSTLSALIAMAHARAGRTVTLLSLDPAHNQSDIFQTPIGESPVTVAPGLRVREPDIDRWIARVLEETHQRMREHYSYLTALNLEQYFRVLRHSPGLEEFALRAAFQNATAADTDADIVVVDLPPTALALRFFSSPTLSGIWTEELIRLRRTIKEKREIITRIRFGRSERELDRVLVRLEEERRAYDALRTLFADPARARVTVVINPDLLSWMEARRIVTALAAVRTVPTALAVNKWTAETDRTPLPPELIAFPRLLLPLAPAPLIGLEPLRRYLEKLPIDLANT
ncbi:MAG: ArsA-related P-loop ATPase [Bacteroidota bacterium]|jgi:arsenite-transporting ATPase|nr:ArsA-related P-loop ATPase [Bacteroidota bacterium]